MLLAPWLLPTPLDAQDYSFITVAGVAVGSSDGTNTNARFNHPQGITIGSSGNLYVTDTFNYTIRELVSAGADWVAKTLAGSPGMRGSIDGTNIDVRFQRPNGVVADAVGNLYVADSTANTIRKIEFDGLNWVVTTIAGSPGISGSMDGTNDVARFNNPVGLAIDGAGNIYVADTQNSTVRKIVYQGPDRIVTTLAGYPGLNGKSDGNGTNALFNKPQGVAADAAGNVYIADTGNHAFRRITPDGTVTTIAGQPGFTGKTDAVGNAALFNSPSGVSIHSSGTLFIADTGNFTIRSITPVGTDWFVTTLAGTAGLAGTADGTNKAALFAEPFGIAVSIETNIYVTDSANHMIRKIQRVEGNWITTTVSGTSSQGRADGTNSGVRFYGPEGITTDNSGTFFVSDTDNNTIRKMVHQGSNWIVTTIAGNTNTTTTGSLTDGTNTSARFWSPQGLALDTNGAVYVADTLNGAIRRIVQIGTNWVTKTLGTGFGTPRAVSLDAAGNVYVAHKENSVIRRMVPSGTNWLVSVIAGLSGNTGSADGTNSSARFKFPDSVALDTFGNVYVTDYGNKTIRKVAPLGTNWVVTTIAGTVGVQGSTDGTNNQAQFQAPSHIITDGVSNLYVCDRSSIRRIAHSGTNWIVTTITGPGSTFTFFRGFTIDSAANLYVTDKNNNAISFGEPRFRLAVSSFSNDIVLSWSAAATNYVLESTVDSSNWVTLSNGIFPSGDAFVWTNAASPGSAFYRLRRQ